MEQTLTSAYLDARSFLYGFIDYERTPRWKYDTEHFNLDRVEEYLAALGSPHRHGWYIHIAGTNGKGSVAAMTARALKTAGFRTGLYTSPHLVSFRERIRVDGRAMTREDVVRGVERIREATGHYEGLTFFEVWTALAFDHFRFAETDAAVIEVGMGGRLDTTNVIMPDVSVITSISMDHAGILGSTIEAIAREKAGIIKPGIPVVSAPQYPEVESVLAKTAAESGSELLVVGKDIGFEIANDRINYSGIKWKLDDVAVPLYGRAQRSNAALALAALEVLSRNGRAIETVLAREGVETVRWPGRLQLIARNPDVVVDGACNIDAMNEVCSFASAQASRESTVAVVAMCRDKDIRGVLEKIDRCAGKLVLTEVENPRALEAGKLAEFAPSGSDFTVEPDTGEALRRAVEAAGSGGLVLVTGSLYLVGDVLKRFDILNDEII